MYDKETKNHNHMKKIIVGICIMAGLAGCASVDQQLAAGYGANIMARKATTDGLQFGKVTAAQGTAMLGYTDQARALLDTGYAARNTSKDQTLSYIQKAMKIINSVDSTLTAEGILK